MTENKKLSSVILGAAFLMATSAVGPGFLTQTAEFSQILLASFGFVILLSVVIDIFAQLNIWRVLAVSGKRGQDVANETIAGSGYLLAGLIVFGGLAFNIGNIAGAGLGLEVLFGLKPEYGAIISAFVGIGIFLFKDAGKAMDFFVKVLGFVMLVLIIYVVIVSRPPLGQAVYHTFFPETISPFAIVTLVGGTVGGYITFAGVHRLIDAGISGKDSLKEVNISATTGIILTAIIRFLLFFAALGVLTLGFTFDKTNPASSIFQSAAGNIGYKIFGVVIWAAAITSVIGAAYTSVSFLKTFNEKLSEYSQQLIIAFIAFSTFIFVLIGKPKMVLILAGTFNGFILPVGLALVLLASRKSEIIGDYKHPVWLQIVGWLVVAVMFGFSVLTIIDKFI
ncbi:MAG: divalent metal cation transporter [Acidobacteriota bacterium]|nr:divalent metal cation transporter [Acidobacteriota bacterium]